MLHKQCSKETLLQQNLAGFVHEINISIESLYIDSFGESQSSNDTLLLAKQTSG